ncbi:unnamed protein product, partial [Scytosiphon promiscuus]
MRRSIGSNAGDGGAGGNGNSSFGSGSGPSSGSSSGKRTMGKIRKSLSRRLSLSRRSSSSSTPHQESSLAGFASVPASDEGEAAGEMDEQPEPSPDGGTFAAMAPPASRAAASITEPLVPAVPRAPAASSSA